MEIVNQDGHISHIHRNILVPYYPKEPIIFPFIQHYQNLNNVCNCKTNCNCFISDEELEPINVISDSNVEPVIKKIQFRFTTRVI